MSVEPRPTPTDRSVYISEPVQVVLACQDALARAWPRPLAVSALLDLVGPALRESDGIEVSRDQVYRAMRNLERRDYAEEVSGGWLIGRRLTLLSESIRQRGAELMSAYLGAGHAR